MAAGAAPLALLLAGPTAALADTPRAELPLDLHHHGSTSDLHLTHDESAATRDLPVATGSTLHQALAPDAVGQSQQHDLRLPAPARAVTGNDLDLRRTAPLAAGLNQSMKHGVQLPHGVDTLSSSTGSFSGDLLSGAQADRVSAEAVDLGPLGSVVENSDEHAVGRFAGTLELAGTERHSVSGELGPLHTLAATSQDTTEPANRFHGELSLTDLAAAQVSTGTELHSAVSQSQHVRASALGEPLGDYGWTVSAPPFTFSPS
jgi:hypothetical protein